MALGLTGHLSNLATMNVHNYLSKVFIYFFYHLSQASKNSSLQPVVIQKYCTHDPSFNTAICCIHHPQTLH